MFNRFLTRWNTRGGYKDVLMVAGPLILSTGAWSVQQFVDRMFLTWYSPESIAASVPAGLLNFTILSLFIGSASYVSAFVAQYYGAGRPTEIGKAVWHGFYLSLLVVIPMSVCIPLSDTIFSIVGHPPEVMQLEARYFAILCMGGVFPVTAAAIGGFFSGLGSTWIVMWVNILATIVNIILDYLMVFGKLGFPEMGITGAGVATVISGAISTLLFFAILLRKKYRIPYHIMEGLTFDKDLFIRIIRYGFPNGIQFFIDMLGFTLFILLVGKLGKVELAATNIALNINMLAFMPMVGCGIAVSVLVGQHLGNRKPERAEFVTWSAVHLSIAYIGIISICYLVVPQVFLKPFGYDGDSQTYQQIVEYGMVLMRFIAYFSIFDMFAIVFSSAIKGAGDTRFVMKTILISSWGILILPTYLVIEVLKWNLYAAWVFAALYITTMGSVFYLRFKKGKWKSMLVIEQIEEQQLVIP